MALGVIVAGQQQHAEIDPPATEREESLTSAMSSRDPVVGPSSYETLASKHGYGEGSPSGDDYRVVPTSAKGAAVRYLLDLVGKKASIPAVVETKVPSVRPTIDELLREGNYIARSHNTDPFRRGDVATRFETLLEEQAAAEAELAAMPPLTMAQRLEGGMDNMLAVERKRHILAGTVRDHGREMDGIAIITGPAGKYLRAAFAEWTALFKQFKQPGISAAQKSDLGAKCGVAHEKLNEAEALVQDWVKGTPAAAKWDQYYRDLEFTYEAVNQKSFAVRYRQGFPEGMTQELNKLASQYQSATGFHPTMTLDALETAIQGLRAQMAAASPYPHLNAMLKAMLSHQYLR